MLATFSMSEFQSAQKNLAKGGRMLALKKSLSTNVDAVIRAGNCVSVRARVFDRRYSAEEEGSRPRAHQTQTLRNIQYSLSLFRLIPGSCTLEREPEWTRSSLRSGSIAMREIIRASIRPDMENVSVEALSQSPGSWLSQLRSSAAAPHNSSNRCSSTSSA